MTHALRKRISDLAAQKPAHNSYDAGYIRGATEAFGALYDAPTAVRRYTVRSEKGAWIGTFFVSLDGLFTCITDYGNYGHYWGSPGDGGVRQLLVTADNGYLASKLAQKVYDGPATLASMMKAIAEQAKRLPKEDRRGWIDSEHMLLERYKIGETDQGLLGWREETELEDLTEIVQMQREPDCVRMLELAMPKLREMLKAEMQEEASRAAT